MTQRAIDWGAPRPADWVGPKERVTARVSVDIAAALRRQARDEGVSFNTYMQRLFREAVGLTEEDPIPDVSYDGYNPFR